MHDCSCAIRQTHPDPLKWHGQVHRRRGKDTGSDKPTDDHLLLDIVEGLQH